MGKLARLTLDLSVDLRTKLKIAAARRGTTIRSFCLEAITRSLAVEMPEEARELLDESEGRRAAWDGMPLARELRREIFGNRVLSVSAAELVTEGRRERLEELP